MHQDKRQNFSGLIIVLVITVLGSVIGGIVAVEYEHRWRGDRQRAEQESRSDERNRLTENEQSLAEQERSEESSDCEARAQLVCEATTAWQDLTRKLFEHPGGPD